MSDLLSRYILKFRGYIPGIATNFKLMKRNSILIVSSYLPPEQSGSGYHAYRFAKYLIISGYPAHLLSFNRNLKYKKQTNITRIPYLNKGIGLKLLSLPVIIIYYFFLVIRFNTIIIYGNKIIAYQIIIILAQIFRRKIVFQSLLPGVDDLDTVIKHRVRFIEKMNKWLLNSVTVYFSINNIFSKSFISNSFTKPILFESTQGVNTNLFKPVSAEKKGTLLNRLDLPERKFIILAPGLLIKRKGYEAIFHSLAHLDIDFLLIVAGQNSPVNSILPKKENDEMIYLKELGHSLLKKRVMFTGVVENIKEYMQIADMMILNSENEGMPNVLLEAFACALPVLCRKLEGVTENILQHKMNSLIYEDSNEITKHITFLIHNPSERIRIGNNAREYALKYLSFDKVTKDLFFNLKI
jgi:glycosyltransferase involved in cell wall biosynthesis